MGRGQARRISQRFFYRYLCMSYVDLNPTPASSDYTSIQARIQTYQSPTPEPNQDSSQTTQTPVKLIDFIGHEHKNQPEGIAFSFSDYMKLVDWTGQVVRDDKTGAIAESLPPFCPDWVSNTKPGWIPSTTTTDGFSGR